MEALELQILQFCEEVRAELSATREGLRPKFAQAARRQMEEMRTELLARIAEGDEETRRYMRVLHEEVIARIATIGAGGRSHSS